MRGEWDLEAALGVEGLEAGVGLSHRLRAENCIFLMTQNYIQIIKIHLINQFSQRKKNRGGDGKPRSRKGKKVQR